MISESASTRVVINGEATTAGSSFNRFTSKGKSEPIALAITMVVISDTATTAAIGAI